MAGDDTITYDYTTLETCVDMMSRKAGEIQAQTDGLESDVKRIMVDWRGATADAYNQLCDHLRGALGANVGNLQTLKGKLEAGAAAMQHQDNRGGQGLH
ncbi:WXG100 family type VII secretion target [Amycolatopsis sp. NPDC059090]|uniref:WXG100 family type VII secretion target n=1 Tax=Amycolatopsis sp. NPDC059090 TaxID=3346723 RepID=UPI00366FF8BB